MIRFSLVRARQQAWSTAVRLAGLAGRGATTGDRRRRHRGGAGIAHLVAHPGPAGSAVLLLVRSRERAAPATVMDVLANVKPASF